MAAAAAAAAAPSSDWDQHEQQLLDRLADHLGDHVAAAADTNNSQQNEKSAALMKLTKLGQLIMMYSTNSLSKVLLQGFAILAFAHNAAKAQDVEVQSEFSFLILTCWIREVEKIK